MHRGRVFPRKSSRAIGLAVFLTLPAAGGRADVDWQAADGNWSDPGNWSTSAVPGNGDMVFIANGDSTNRTISFDYTGPLVTLASININNSGGGTDSLLLANTGETLSSFNEFIGGQSSESQAGVAAVIQSGGVNFATGEVLMAQGAGSVADYDLSGGTLNCNGNFTLNVDGNVRYDIGEVIGLAGTAVFNQSGGTHITSGDGTIVIGTNIGSTGIYNLSGTGTLSSSGNEMLGFGGGQGVMTQCGGLNVANYISLAFFGSSSTYSLSAGSISVHNGELIGAFGGSSLGQPGGIGIFNQSGGLNTIVGDQTLPFFEGLEIGEEADATGEYNLSGGTLSATNSDGNLAVEIGYSGTGIFNQSGGSAVLNCPVKIGIGEGSVGTYNLSGGSLTVNLNPSTGLAEAIGNYGNGSFIQTGGTHTISSGNSIYIAAKPGSTGSYILSGTGTLSVSGAEFIGFNGSANFNQSGGQNLTGFVIVAAYGATATYTMSGGAIVAGNGENIGLGEYNFQAPSVGCFNQSGGTNTIMGDSGMVLGLSAGSTGTYHLSGGSLTFTNTVSSYFIDEDVGYDGTGIFNQSGGTHSTFNLNLGVNAGAVGNYTLSAGSLSALNEIVGAGGTGTFIQSGGTNTVAAGGLLSIAPATGAVGTYILSGGLLTAPGACVSGSGYYPDENGNGVLTVCSSGHLAIAGQLMVWNNGRVNLNVPSTSVGNLNIVGNGVVNLNGALQINYASPDNDPIASVVTYLQSGCNNGAWTGTSGIISTSAQNPAGLALSIGYADGNTDAATAAGPNQIAVKLTLAGDANLDGFVNFADLVAVIQNFNKPNTDWSQGNFTYASSTSFADLVLVIQNFNKQLPPPGNAAQSLGLSTIQATDVQFPEPGGIALAAGAVGLLMRRRRRI